MTDNNEMFVDVPEIDDGSSIPISLHSKYLYFYRNIFGKNGQLCQLNEDNQSINVVACLPTSFLSNEVAASNSMIFFISSRFETFKIAQKSPWKLIAGPDPPEWRQRECIAFWNNKLYYIGGLNKKLKPASEINIFENQSWKKGPNLPIAISNGSAIVCNDNLYVIDNSNTGSIYVLSGESWIKAGKFNNNKWLSSIGVLDDKIYITMECEVFDPKAPEGYRIKKIADMKYERQEHSLVASNGKLYAVGGYCVKDTLGSLEYCKYVEVYDPTNNKWTVADEYREGDEILKSLIDRAQDNLNSPKSQLSKIEEKWKQAKNETYIGIDLGTTYSCVAVVENGQPIAIFNSLGENTTPSVVAYSDMEILVGNPAIESSVELSNILYDSKRLIGWKILYDLPIAKDRHLWTFNTATQDDCVGYILNKGTSNEKFVKPEEVSAEVLKYLKSIAERYLSKKITAAVVTIPASFNNEQISSTMKAIELAGLELQCALQEPTAAAIAYNYKLKLQNSLILIFDFGGGTLDVNIIEIINGKLRIRAASGEPHLGGQDFDGRIMEYAIDSFIVSSNFDVYSKPRLIKRLRNECRKTKEALSTHEGPLNIHLDIRDDLELNVELTREKFNELCEELFDRTQMCVDRVLNMAKLSETDIEYVILVGGSSKISRIREKLGNQFGESKLKFDINPDEAVALGAAIYASSMQEPNYRQNEKVLFYMRYGKDPNEEGRICLFNSITFEVEIIENFSTYVNPCEVATGNDQIFLIAGWDQVFEMFNYETKQLTEGPDPPEWRKDATVAYYKNKLYYIGGMDSNEDPTSWVNILVNGKWQRGTDFPIKVKYTRHSICNDKLYIICKDDVFQLSDDEREWIEVGEMEERRWSPAVASLNGKIYITGGYDGANVYNSCLCFDPFYREFTSIANMHFNRHDHSLVVANGKIYAIGGSQKISITTINTELSTLSPRKFCKSVEEYDPTIDTWRIVGRID